MDDLQIIPETSLRPGQSFRHDVVRYITRCHLDDGGYFFARVPPSSGMDTYFAVKSLSILGVELDRQEETANFFLNEFKAGALTGLTGIFTGVEVLGELGRLTEGIKDHAHRRIMLFQNEAGGFGVQENISVEVASELQGTYRAVRVLNIIGADFEVQKVRSFVSGLMNPDGGYGGQGHSTLASTGYATEIFNLIGAESEKASTIRYLRKREESWQVQYIEDLYWLTTGLTNLGEKSTFRDKVCGFVMQCRRETGGFSRATAIGIPTLEYTFYALSILSAVGAL